MLGQQEPSAALRNGRGRIRCWNYFVSCREWATGYVKLFHPDENEMRTVPACDDIDHR